MSSVLESTPPRFTADEAARIAAELFGLHGTASALGSERDQAFLLEDGGAGGVLKISNSGEDAAVLDLEEAAIAHVTAVDPDLPVARPLAPRAAFDGHEVRLFERRHGHKAGPELDDAAVREVAATHARLCLALRSFFHPAAGRELLWNLRSAPLLRPLLGEIAEPERQALAARALDGYDERVLPRWERLRAQVVHGDFNLDNLLRRRATAQVTGILDFGDCCHTALAADVAVALASFLRGRPPEDAVPGGPDRAGRLLVAAPARAARSSSCSATSSRPGWSRSSRSAPGAHAASPRTPTTSRPGTTTPGGCSRSSTSWGRRRWRASSAHEPARREPRSSAGRRDEALGALLTPLTYARPVHAVRAEGVWIHEPDGSRLLDAYNNVPVVGHCHPRVTEAIVRQTRLSAVNARYLAQPLVELAERLLATFPPEAGLDTVLLVNSGSEANDLAWRLAAGTTGNAGALVTEHAYHGVTTATTALSPEEWPPQSRPSHVVRIPPPGSGADLARALDALDVEPRCDVSRRVAHERRDLSRRRQRSCSCSSSGRTLPAGSTSPTRCRPATAGSAPGSGRSRGTASRRTSSRSASRWGTAIPSPRS